MKTLFTTVVVGPIEQKPIYHFKPGSTVLSVGTVGCNLKCAYCQNFEISQVSKAKGVEMTAEEVVQLALERKASSIAYTYNEPLTWHKSVLEIATEAKAHGLYNLLKTNGYASSDVFSKVADKMDVINVDVKGTAKLYSEVCGVELEDDPRKWVILKNLRSIPSKCLSEVSIIVIPGYEEGIDQMLPIVREHCPADTAIHLLRFIPDFKMRNVPPASMDQLRQAKEKALKYFSNVYIDFAGEDCNTKCIECNQDLVRRRGIKILLCNVDGTGKCLSCGFPSSIRME